MSAVLTIPDLAGKAVLITGASTGIGAALAKAFAGQGAQVGLHYNSSAEAAHAVAREIEDAGGSVVLLRGDATNSADMGRIVEETVRTFGKLEGLINNAGGMVARVLYENLTDDHYDKVMDLNGRSVLSATTAAIPHLKKQGGFVPGIRPGQKTIEYLDYVVSRLLVIGAAYLTAVCLLPEVLISEFSIPFYFGGTSLLIVVSVTMDTITQVQSHMLAHQYEGLIEKSRLRSKGRGSKPRR